MEGGKEEVFCGLRSR